MTVRRDSAAAVPARAAWPEVVLLGVLVFACLMLVPKMIDTARFDTEILRFPFQVDDAEGVVIAEAQLIAKGIDPYAYQPSPAPYFYAGPYTPFYTLMNSAAIGVAGPTFKFGRAVQLIATLGVAAWLLWAVRRAGMNRRERFAPGLAPSPARPPLAGDGLGVGANPGSISIRSASVSLLGGWIALLFASTHLVAVWSVRVRPDMTALAWNLLGVVVLRAWLDLPERATWRAENWPRGAMLGRLALGAACFALGWWTKQTFVAVPVAFLVSTVICRPKVALTVGALYAAMIAVPFASLTALTGGGFAQKTIGYQGSWEWIAFRRLGQPLIERYGWLLVIAAVSALFLLIRQRLPTFAVCWFALTAVLALGAGTSGGNHNHFVELIAAAMLLSGQGLALFIAPGPRLPISSRMWVVAALTAGLIALSVVALAEREGTAGWLARDYRAPTASEREGLAAVAAYIANSPGPVYSNNVGILVVAGQSVRITDPFTMAAEVRLGRWDDAALIADVAEGKYPLIALSYNDVASLDPDLPPTDATPGLIRAIQARYRLVERNVLRLYVPK